MPVGTKNGLSLISTAISGTRRRLKGSNAELPLPNGKIYTGFGGTGLSACEDSECEDCECADCECADCACEDS